MNDMVEIMLNFLIVLAMILVSALTAMTKTQSTVEVMTVTVLTLSAYIALNLGVIKMRQYQMQQDIKELKSLLSQRIMNNET